MQNTVEYGANATLPVNSSWDKRETFTHFTLLHETVGTFWDTVYFKLILHWSFSSAYLYEWEGATILSSFFALNEPFKY
jgi:hypothetical protein